MPERKSVLLRVEDPAVYDALSPASGRGRAAEHDSAIRAFAPKVAKGRRSPPGQHQRHAPQGRTPAARDSPAIDTVGQ